MVIIFAITACQSSNSDSKNIDSTNIIADTTATATMSMVEDTRCFEEKIGKDITTVKLAINGDVVTGEMEWLPYEKDGAVGTLKGKKVGDEIIVDYDYVIEGSNQSEEKIFKLDGEKLLVKEGELTEDKSGKLIMKDPTGAKFSQTLLKVKCN